MQTNTVRYIHGTVTEMIILNGDTENGRDIETVIPSELAKKLLDIGGKAYAVCGHVGHALWHIENNNTDFENCWSCQNRKDK